MLSECLSQQPPQSASHFSGCKESRYYDSHKTSSSHTNAQEVPTWIARIPRMAAGASQDPARSRPVLKSWEVDGTTSNWSSDFKMDPKIGGHVLIHLGGRLLSRRTPNQTQPHTPRAWSSLRAWQPACKTTQKPRQTSVTGNRSGPPRQLTFPAAPAFPRLLRQRTSGEKAAAV